MKKIVLALLTMCLFVQSGFTTKRGSTWRKRREMRRKERARQKDIARKAKPDGQRTEQQKAATTQEEKQRQKSFEDFKKQYEKPMQKFKQKREERRKIIEERRKKYRREKAKITITKEDEDKRIERFEKLIVELSKIEKNVIKRMEKLGDITKADLEDLKKAKKFLEAKEKERKRITKEELESIQEPERKKKCRIESGLVADRIKSYRIKIAKELKEYADMPKLEKLPEPIIKEENKKIKEKLQQDLKNAIKGIVDSGNIAPTDPLETKKRKLKKTFDPIQKFLKYCKEGKNDKLKKLLATKHEQATVKEFIEKTGSIITGGFIEACEKPYINIIKTLINNYGNDDVLFPTDNIKKAMINATENGNTKALAGLFNLFHTRKIFIPLSHHAKVLRDSQSFWSNFSWTTIRKNIVTIGVITTGVVMLGISLTGLYGEIGAQAGSYSAEHIIPHLISATIAAGSMIGLGVAHAITKSLLSQEKASKEKEIWNHISESSGGEIKEEDFKSPLRFWAANALIQIAAKKGDENMISFLLHDDYLTEFDPNMKNFDSFYLMMSILNAATGGYKNIVRKLMKVLIKKTIKLEEYPEKSPNNMDIIQTENGVSFKYIDLDNELLDKLLYKGKKPELISEILYQTNPNQKFDLCEFAINEGLYSAAIKGHVNVVKHFLEHFKTKIEMKVVDRALQKTTYPTIKKRLQEFKEKPKAEEERGYFSTVKSWFW